ncbi:MAG: hypothetical protein RL156_1734 [Bacteroidota bacterium]|jgi:hypothetical protein
MFWIVTDAGIYASPKISRALTGDMIGHSFFIDEHAFLVDAAVSREHAFDGAISFLVRWQKKVNAKNDR